MRLFYIITKALTLLFFFPINTFAQFSGGEGRGDFSVGTSTPVSLPVAWVSFTAEKFQDKVNLYWSTATEQNTKDFEVFHSIDASQWTLLGSRLSAGNSNVIRDYSFTHAAPLKNNVYNYYRIKQNDLDGKYSYSKIVSIIYNEPGQDVLIYPNPVVDVVNIYLAESQQLKLFTISGTMVWQGNMTAGNNKLWLNHLPSGIYFLQTQHGSRRITVQRN